MAKSGGDLRGDGGRVACDLVMENQWHSCSTCNTIFIKH